LNISFETLHPLCPEAEEEFVREHLSRLEERYFQFFNEAQIAEHLDCLRTLSSERPVRILLRAQSRGRLDCTILAYDYPGEFSLITGILAASGFNILTGEVFTYSRYKSSSSKSRSRGTTFASRLRKSRTIQSDPLRRRRIIDYFSGTVSSQVSPEVWENRVRARLIETISLLEKDKVGGFEIARQRINEMVAQHLSTMPLPAEAVLYPLQIEVTPGRGGKDTVTVVTQDTPVFLYALSTALALRSIFIESIRIRTVENRIEDEFSFIDAKGRRINDSVRLDQVKFSVLLTKQFTYFLASAPDPYAALCRFEQLVESVLALPEQGRWSELLSNPLVMKELARLLGASDYLWEDFIRLQYETILPMLQPALRGESFSSSPDTLPERLSKALSAASTLKQHRRILNEFKDREIYLLELDHIVRPEADFRFLSEGLTRLAEVVVSEALRMAYERLVERFGEPRTVAGLPARYSIFGLGKLGGGDLGYASDIELLFVYSDSGRTDGAEAIGNGEFFDALVRETSTSIRAKKEGIFHIDLRLRPHGASGPTACSLENFCRYYGPGGEAHPLEKLALVRLRSIGGDRELGEQVERLRDEMLYTGQPLDIARLRQARQKQLDARTRRGELNAKFSPGALLDLEYAVMFLQLSYGGQRGSLRTPFIRVALDRLQEAGILAAEQVTGLVQSYEFLRRLINSLRMLRGSAQDLFLPSTEAAEFVHLARRMGYLQDAELSPAQKLHLDFETQTAFVRAFIETTFGRESLPVPGIGNVADLILSDNLPAGLPESILQRAGFANPKRAYTNLRRLSATGASPLSFARLAVLATDLLRSQPDPDMALNNWERLLGFLNDPEEHFELLLSQPKRLEILLSIFAGSQFLSDSLIRNPEFFEWATLPEHLHEVRKRTQIEALFRELSRSADSDTRWRNDLRRFKRREVLRIGIRDICLDAPIEEIMQELTVLAEALLQVALERAWARVSVPELADRFCLLAFGKLGGEELNYSSDIDLLALCTDSLPQDSEGVFRTVMETLRGDLATHTEEGSAYRVDLRLRPFGRSGELVGSLAGISRYFREQASLWEIQALLRARPVAGNTAVGFRFLSGIKARFFESRRAETIVASLEKMRDASHGKISRGIESGSNIKLGPGGIRDVEFLVQGLQLIRAGAGQQAFCREDLSGNTLTALEALKGSGVIPPEEAEQLRRDYLFLRRIEHYLQIFEDRQTHTLPKDPTQLQALARRMLGAEAGTPEFMKRVDSCMARVETAYHRFLPVKSER